MTKEELIKEYRIKVSKIDDLFEDDNVARPLKRIYLKFISDLENCNS